MRTGETAAVTFAGWIEDRCTNAAPCGVICASDPFLSCQASASEDRNTNAPITDGISACFFDRLPEFFDRLPAKKCTGAHPTLQGATCMCQSQSETIQSVTLCLSRWCEHDNIRTSRSLRPPYYQSLVRFWRLEATGAGWLQKTQTQRLPGSRAHHQL